MKNLYVWPCGTWCWPEDIGEMEHMSDDYCIVKVTDACDDEDAERIADMEAMSHAEQFADVFHAIGGQS